MNLDSNCNNLDAYLSGDLLGDNRAIFESHLEGCPACSNALGPAAVDRRPYCILRSVCNSNGPRQQLSTPSVYRWRSDDDVSCEPLTA